MQWIIFLIVFIVIMIVLAITGGGNNESDDTDSYPEIIIGEKVPGPFDAFKKKKDK